MTNWSYGTGVLPTEQLNESQGTKDVKGAIKAIESSYASYNGYMTKATGGSADGKQIMDKASFDKAVNCLNQLGEAVKNVKEVLTFYQKGLITGNKKLGGGLNAQALGNLINTCEKKFQELSANIQKMNQNNGAAEAQPATTGAAQNNANPVTAKAQSLGIDPNTPISNLSPEQIKSLLA